jgi:hypothetical protein
MHRKCAVLGLQPFGHLGFELLGPRRPWRAGAPWGRHRIARARSIYCGAKLQSLSSLSSGDFGLVPRSYRNSPRMFSCKVDSPDVQQLKPATGTDANVHCLGAESAVPKCDLLANSLTLIKHGQHHLTQGSSKSFNFLLVLVLLILDAFSLLSAKGRV